MSKFMQSLILCSLITCGVVTASEPSESKESYRVLQFENDLVKVWKTVIMPHQPLSFHRHDCSRVVVGLKGGSLTKIEETGERSSLVFETGKAYWLTEDLPGTLHADINESDDPIEVMVIEYKASRKE
jgi:hypothetical protein